MSIGNAFLPSDEEMKKKSAVFVDAILDELAAKLPPLGATLAGKKVVLKAEVIFHLEVVDE